MDEETEEKMGDKMRAKRDYNYDAYTEVLYNADPEYARRYDAYAEHVLRRDDALSRKNRELIIIAFAASEGQVEACRNHIASAIKHGATLDEIFQTFQLTSRLAGAWSSVTAAEAINSLEESLAYLDVDLDELDIDLDRLQALRE